MIDKPKKILVVDDSRNFIAYVSLLLRKMGFRKIVSAENGLEALHILKMWLPDIIMLDFEMPGLDGISTLERIKEKEELSGIPVVMVNSVKDMKAMKRCTALGCAAYLVKPLKINSLHDALQHCVRRSGNNRRVHLRTPYSKKVLVSHKDMTEECQALTVSEGGVYLQTSRPFAVGTEIEMTIPLQGGSTLRLNGDVIYKGTGSMPPGMAVEFKGITQKDSKTLSSYITGVIRGTYNSGSNKKRPPRLSS